METLANILIFIMDQVGYAVCHQMPERTLVFGGRHLPVCARDTGLFLGIAVCLIALFIAYRKSGGRYPSPFKTAALACFVIPTIADAVTSYAGLRTTTNDIRLVTGTLAGVGIAALAFPIVSRAFFTNRDERKIFRTWWPVFSLLLIPAVIFLAVQPGWPIAYWIWAGTVTVAIVFTFFILSYTLLFLVAEWRTVEIEAGFNFSMAFYTGLVTILELALFNLMHWLVYKL